jgi:hypothetical protein
VTKKKPWRASLILNRVPIATSSIHRKHKFHKQVPAIVGGPCDSKANKGGNFIMSIPRPMLAVGAMLLFSMSAFAGGRSDWRHDSGRFENTNGLQWVENAPDGNTYYFREVCRTEGYVDMYDRSRDCTVRLSNSACYVKFGDDRFQRYYYGAWRR